MPINDDIQLSQILDFEKFLADKNLSLDFSLTRLVENPELVTKSLFKKITKEQYKIQTDWLKFHCIMFLRQKNKRCVAS